MEEGSCSSSHRLRELCGGGEGKGIDVATIRAQLVQRFGKNSARKPRYPTTGASFLRSIAGCFSVAGRIPGSAHRPIRGRPTTRGFPVGIPRVSCQDLPWGLCYFRLARHSDSEEQLALSSVRFSCLLPEATPYGYRAAILRMPCNLDASSSIPISSSAW